MEKPQHVPDSSRKEKESMLATNSLLKKNETSIQYGGVVSTDHDVPLLADDNRTNRFSIRSFTIEPVLFAYLASYSMNIACLTNMMMDKGCRFHFNFTEDICRNLSGHHAEKEEVEILANNFSMYNRLMGLIGAVMMIFIAPWSDKYGRKLPLFVTCAGSLVSDIGLLLCSIKFDSKLEYLLLAKVPSELTGGFVCLLTMVFSHASEVTTPSFRSMKYAFVEIALGLGMSIGMVTGGMVYKYYGYSYVYVIGATLRLICLAWVLFVVEETRGLDSVTTWKDKVCDFFTYDNLTTGWKTSVRRRENSGRAIMWLCFASMCVVVLCYESLGGMGYVYVHHIFNWDAAKYSIFNTVFSLTQMVVMFITAPLLIKYLNVPDYVIGIIGTFSMIGRNIFVSFAWGHMYLYYIGYALGYWAGFSSLALRTGLSKISDKDELGRVFAFLSILEASFPLIGTLFVTKVFNASIDFYPNLGYLTFVLMLMLPLGTFTFAHLKTRNVNPSPFAVIGSSK